MTTDNKKRDRRTGVSKTTTASPNRRQLKQQQNEELDEEMEETDEEMKEIEEDKGKDENDPSQALQIKFDNASVDWKKKTSEEGKDGWSIIKLPGPTEAWTGLSDGQRKVVHGLLSEDLRISKWPLLLKDAWKDLNAIYKIQESTAFGDQLTQDLEADKATMFGRKRVKIFKCLLALSRTEISHFE